MKLLVAGSRTISSTNAIYKVLNEYVEEHGDKLSIISGGAKGVDTVAAEFAKSQNIPFTEVPADWDKHGRAAGFIRNKEMWEMADEGVVFWDGVSKGTAHSFKLSEQMNKKLRVFRLVP